MDLSFARIPMLSSAHVVVLPVELAVLLVGVVSRQAASPTARAQALLRARAAAALAPVSGAFDAATAAAITGWKEG